MKKIVMITGVTSGIGKAIAHLLAKNHYDLIITGRRKPRLDDLKKEIMQNYDADVLSLDFDIRDHDAVKEHTNKLEGKWVNIDILINNAGLAVGLDHIHEGDTDDWERMIDTNIKGLLYITKIIASKMTKRKSGHIINISSVSGKEVYEFGNVYCATKHAVDALSKAMRIDLLKHNVKVTNIAPGMVDTEFSEVRFKGDAEKADKVYEGFTPLHAEDVAEAILFAMNRPAHVNINDLLIMPTAQATTSHTYKKDMN